MCSTVTRKSVTGSPFLQKGFSLPPNKFNNRREKPVHTILIMNGEGQNCSKQEQQGQGDIGKQQQGNFSLASVHKHFHESLLDSQEIDLKHYCDAWHELNR